MSTSMIEIYAVTDTYVSSIGRVVELAPGLFRVIFCADVKDAHDGSTERVVVDKLIMTPDTMAAMARQLAAGASSELLTLEGHGDQVVS